MRASGILMGISSIPSKYGMGCFSKEAYEFVDQLEQAGQQYWQILPLGPTGYGDSPYQSVSTFAGNPYFINLEDLIEKGLLTRGECESCDWGGSESYVDYEKMYMSRYKLLRKAYERADLSKDEDYADFLKEEQNWLTDYCLLWRSRMTRRVSAGSTGRKNSRTVIPKQSEKQRKSLKRRSISIVSSSTALPHSGES